VEEAHLTSPLRSTVLKYYVNWSYGKCALDCPEGSAAGCGGVASSWDAKHDTQAECCSAISWVSDSACVYGATTTTSTTGATTTSTSGTTTTTQATATGWYVDGDMCTLGQSTQTLYTSATACCTNQLSWMSNELCVSISTGVPTNMFYADQIASVCKQDCPAGNGLPCGGSPSDLSLTLYSSLASCCTTKIPWEPSCVDKSNGNEPQGTGKYYVNWSYGKCALDCPEGSAAGCGGVASNWDVKHDTQAACCSAISWVPDCLYT